MEEEKIAAQNLIDRAFTTSLCSTAYMLIDAAKRINPNIDTVSIKRQWLNQWMESQYQTMKG